MAFDPLNKVGHQQLNPELNNEFDNHSSSLDLLFHRQNKINHITGEERRKWNEILDKANDYTDYQLESIIGQFDFSDNNKTLIENMHILLNEIKTLISANDEKYTTRFINLENRVTKLESRADGHDKEISNIKSDITTKYNQVESQITDTNNKLYLEQLARQSADNTERATTITQITELKSSLESQISDEIGAREYQDNWLKNYIDEQINALDIKTTNNLNQEIQNRKNADAAEEQARINAINNEANIRAQADSTEASARSQGDSDTLKSAKSYADSGDSSTLSSAKSYTDSRINALYKITNTNLMISGGILYYDSGSGNWARAKSVYE